MRTKFWHKISAAAFSVGFLALLFSGTMASGLAAVPAEELPLAAPESIVVAGTPLAEEGGAEPVILPDNQPPEVEEEPAKDVESLPAVDEAFTSTTEEPPAPAAMGADGAAPAFAPLSADAFTDWLQAEVDQRLTGNTTTPISLGDIPAGSALQLTKPIAINSSGPDPINNPITIALVAGSVADPTITVSDEHYHFTFTGVLGVTLSMEGITLDGRARDAGGTLTGYGVGGGILMDHATITLVGGTLQNCEAIAYGTSSERNGGALLMRERSNAAIRGTQFLDNHAWDNGGAIYYDGEFDFSSLSLWDAVLTGNTTGSSSTLTGKGGGIYAQGDGIFTIHNSTIAANKAGLGGGVYYKDAYAIINRSNINNNTASKGGGVYAQESELSFASETDISENTAEYGGGAYITDAIDFAVVEKSRIIFNTATRAGGGLYIEDSDAEIDNAQIIFNHTDGAGGGIYFESYDGTDTLTLTKTETARNTAGDDADGYAGGSGGGIYLDGGKLVATGTSSAPNSFHHNEAEYGGALYIVSAYMALESVTVYNNTATGGGGAVYTFSSTVDNEIHLKNTQFRNNTATLDGGAMNLTRTRLVTSGATLFNNNIAQNGGALALYDMQSVSLDGTSFVGNKAIIDDRPFIDPETGKEIDGGPFTDLTIGEPEDPKIGKAEDPAIKHIENLNKDYLGRGKGGAIWFRMNVSNVPVSINNCTFSENEAVLGGAVANNSIRNTDIYITQSTIEENKAVFGGALATASDASANFFLNSTTIKQNTALYGGGAMLYMGWQEGVVVNWGTFTGNTATYGGGVAVGGYDAEEGALALLNRSDLDANVAVKGGGLYVDGSGRAVLTQGSITGNFAGAGTAPEGQGGGIYVAQSLDASLKLYENLYIKETLFANNWASSGPKALTQADYDAGILKATHDTWVVDVTTRSAPFSVNERPRMQLLYNNYDVQYAGGNDIFTITYDPGRSTGTPLNILEIEDDIHTVVDNDVTGFTMPGTNDLFNGWQRGVQMVGVGETFPVKGNTTLVAWWITPVPPTTTSSSSDGGGSSSSGGGNSSSNGGGGSSSGSSSSGGGASSSSSSSSTGGGSGTSSDGGGGTSSDGGGGGATTTTSTGGGSGSSSRTGGSSSSSSRASSSSSSSSSGSSSSGSGSGDGSSSGTGGGGTSSGIGGGNGTSGTSGASGTEGDDDTDGGVSSDRGSANMQIFGIEIPWGSFGFRDGWSLLSLIMGVLSLVCGVLMLLLAVPAQKRAQAEDRTVWPSRLPGILAGILPILAFLILERLSTPVVLINRWTWLVAALFVIQLALAVWGVLHSNQQAEAEADFDLDEETENQ